eukprot:2422556-Pleurochrysis_carterae.AAC.2
MLYSWGCASKRARQGKLSRAWRGSCCHGPLRHESILALLSEMCLAKLVRVCLLDVVPELDFTNESTAHPVRSGIAELAA